MVTELMEDYGLSLYDVGHAATGLQFDRVDAIVTRDSARMVAPAHSVVTVNSKPCWVVMVTASVPAARSHVIGAVPPVCVNCVDEYSVPVVPPGSDAGPGGAVAQPGGAAV